MAIKNVVIIGAGLMGHGAAQVSLMAGYNVTLVDIKDEFIEKGVSKIEQGMLKLESKNKLGGLTAADVMGRLKKTTDLATAVKDADIVLEAVIEKMDVKKQVFKTCGDNAPAHCVLASNTSSMSITEIAKDSGRPDKCVGIHFFNPVPLMRLIEVIKGDLTSEETMNIGVAWSKSLPCLRGKRYVPRVLKDRPGFIANRVNAPVPIYINWVVDQAAEKGIPWEQLSADVFNPMAPMGPLVLSDYVGHDTALHITNYYSKTLSPDFKPGKVLTEMVNAGNLGAKTGKGYYDWSKGKPILEVSKKAGMLDSETMAAIQANEACRLLEEGVVNNWTIIDETILAGSNSAGPMQFLADGQHDRWIKILEDLAEKTGKSYFKPCDMMRSKKYTSMRV